MNNEQKEPKRVKGREEQEKKKTTEKKSSNEQKHIADDDEQKDTKKSFLEDDANESMESDNEEKKESSDAKKEDKDSKETLKKIQKMAQIMKALETAMRIIMLLKFLAWLKHMLMMLLQAILNAIKALIAWVLNVVNAVLQVTIAVAAFFGMATSVFAGIAIVIVVVAVVVVAIAISEPSASDIAEREGTVIQDDCAEDSINAVSGSAASVSTEIVNEQTNENAQKMYSVLSAYGMTEENIAGVIGNFSAESSIDTYGLEGIYDEKFQIGPKKAEALNDIEAYCIRKGYNTSSHLSTLDNKHYCGFGLAQWTASRAYLLLKFADVHGFNWYDIDCQATFMITKDGGDSNRFFDSWEPEANPEDAAASVCEGYEKPKNYATEAVQKPRKEAAASWYSKMQNGTLVLDVTYGQSILDAAGTVVNSAADTATANRAKTCNSLSRLAANADNSSIASAAVSLCHPYSKLESSKSNRSDNGTELYIEVHDQVGLKGINYRECSKYVGTVIAWCGADKDFPITGNTASQYTYMSTSEKWQEIDWKGDYNNLQPGDILITHGKGHVCIYTGYEAIAAVYPDTPTDKEVVICSASLDGESNGYAPCCRNFYSNLSTFCAFRCVKPDGDTTYKDAGTNVAVDQAVNPSQSPEAPQPNAAPVSETATPKNKK